MWLMTRGRATPLTLCARRSYLTPPYRSRSSNLGYYTIQNQLRRRMLKQKATAKGEQVGSGSGSRVGKSRGRGLRLGIIVGRSNQELEKRFIRTKGSISNTTKKHTENSEHLYK